MAELRVAFLFPGQGEQHPGMLYNLYDNPAASSLIARATELLGFDVLTLDFDPSLNSTIAVQVATLITSVAAFHALDAQGATPDAVAGLSVGAFSAAVACGAMSFEAALTLVRLRAELMQQECPKGYGLSVVVGLSERQVKSLIDMLGTPRAPVYIASLNAPREIVVSGSTAAMDLVLEHALSAGAQRAERLPIAVPSHCVLLSGVARKLKVAIAEVRMVKPRVPYISNATGHALIDVEAIREDLATNVEHTVHWHDATTILYERGVRLFVELPPGHTLSALTAKAFPESRSTAVENNRLDLVAQLIMHHKVLAR